MTEERKRPSAFWRISCWLFGHQLFVFQKFSPESRRIVCPVCGLDEAMNDRVQLVIPWDEEIAEMYRSMGHRIQNPWA